MIKRALSLTLILAMIMLACAVPAFADAAADVEAGRGMSHNDHRMEKTIDFSIVFSAKR